VKTVRKYPNHREIRQEASRILAVRSNRLKLIEALCLCLLLLPIYYCSYNLLAVAEFEFAAISSLVWSWIRSAFLFFFFLLLALPMILGLFGMAERMERGEESDLLDLFCAFSSWTRYAKAVLLSWKLMWLPTVAVWLIRGVLALSEALIVNERDALLTGIFVSIAVGAGALFLFMRRFGVIVKGLRLECCPEAVEAFAKLSGGVRFRCLDKFLGRYLLRLLFGVLSVGILLLMDVIPEMLVAYFRYCRYMNDNDVTSEE